MSPSSGDILWTVELFFLILVMSTIWYSHLTLESWCVSSVLPLSPWPFFLVAFFGLLLGASSGLPDWWARRMFSMYYFFLIKPFLKCVEPLTICIYVWSLFETIVVIVFNMLYSVTGTIKVPFDFTRKHFFCFLISTLAFYFPFSGATVLVSFIQFMAKSLTITLMSFVGSHYKTMAINTVGSPLLGL